MEEISPSYEQNISRRNSFKFFLGIIARIKRFLIFKHSTRIARKRGAYIGKNVCMFPEFAKKLNANITIGDSVSINTLYLSSNRYKLEIGKNTIIGENAKIILGSHDIDSPLWNPCRHSEGLIIEDYVWICPFAIILPSVKKIGKGAVIGAGSVVCKDVPPMAVMGGNPAKEIRKRTNVHHDICVESLLGGDLSTYLKVWRNRTSRKSDN